jgi:hypothetical protein
MKTTGFHATRNQGMGFFLIEDVPEELAEARVEFIQLN